MNDKLSPHSLYRLQAYANHFAAALNNDAAEIAFRDFARLLIDELRSPTEELPHRTEELPHCSGGRTSLARQLYPNTFLVGYHICQTDYSPIVHALGDVLIEHRTGDYQGDTFVLYRCGDGYGYLCFGWGSCSGCDALQACNTYEEVDELIEDLRRRIKVFDTREEALHWFKTHDWEGDFSWTDETCSKFVAAAIDFLERTK